MYVYTTEMIIIEKLRAICQQNPKYKEIVTTHTITPRFRDFFDINLLMEKYPIDITSTRIKELARIIFAAKKVPPYFIKEIGKQRDFHRTDYVSVKDTVKAGVVLKDFDFYFDYVTTKFGAIEF